MSALLIGSALLMCATAAIHSLLGQRRIIGPMFARGDHGLHPRVLPAIRFTWHLTSLLMVLTALTVAWPQTPSGLVRLIGGAYLALGMLSLAQSRGRHISGPLFTSAGLLSLVG